MKIQWKKLVVSLLLPLAAGGLSALLTKNGMEAFGALNKPPLSPPAWLFPVAWTALYLLMGYACYLVWTAPEQRPGVFTPYALQLFFNFFWSVIFFGIGNYLLAFLWLVVLWALILWNTLAFRRTKKAAGWLLVPYLLWVTFAGYLNAGIWVMNR